MEFGAVCDSVAGAEPNIDPAELPSLIADVIAHYFAIAFRLAGVFRLCVEQAPSAPEQDVCFSPRRRSFRDALMVGIDLGAEPVLPGDPASEIAGGLQSGSLEAVGPNDGTPDVELKVMLVEASTGDDLGLISRLLPPRCQVPMVPLLGPPVEPSLLREDGVVPGPGEALGSFVIASLLGPWRDERSMLVSPSYEEGLGYCHCDC